MKILTEEWLILGVTSEGRTFRPSDWSERLCGALANYNAKGRWEYSDYVQPVIYEGKVAVRVRTSLSDIHATHYQFIMDFAVNNRLQVIPTGESISLEETVVETVEEAEVVWSVKSWILALLLHQWKARIPFKNY
ncbi:DUF3579 domain-containing protein [Nitrosomonas sp.]|uniref:DUF3579 domain-containing protein n=1 Tax=Nitrosomonas sp. TaxID=42353 RepID=UPI001D49DCF0|nr:DUF3579 domain-containing protein [Nitrosomonas sp.]MBX3617378.1 DUF3579 domain-containing protein [Nitrosomonas sp.]